MMSAFEAAGWSKLEIIELRAAAMRGTLLELATSGALAVMPGEWRDPRAPQPGSEIEEPPTLEEHSLRYVRDVLAQCGGNKTATATILGVDRRTLYRLLEKAGVHTVTPRPRKFQIEKTLKGDPNTCEVTITNLADDERPPMEPSDYLASAGDR